MACPKEGAPLRITRWRLLWILVVVALVTIELSIVTGLLNLNNLFGFFILFVYALVVVSVLAIVGAVFIGIYVSHRILATQGFTPFEQEMLRMREEVRDLADRVDTVAAKLGVSLPSRGKAR